MADQSVIAPTGSLFQSITKPESCDIPINVKAFCENVQYSLGDCLPKDYSSSLPAKVHLDLRQNELRELVSIWDRWGSSGQQIKFEKKYGYIAHLLHVGIDEQMIRAAIQFWDPSHRCFVFHEVDLMPTIEEYMALLGLEFEAPDKIFRKERKSSHKKKLARLLGVTNQEVEAYEKEKGETRGIPWEILRDFIMKHLEEEKSLAVMALAVYGLVIFPKILGHVEIAVIDFFDQVENQANPVPAILAETLRSLNFCRRNGVGRFVGCAQLLYVWIRSHFECKNNAFRHPLLHPRPILEFLQSKWSEPETKEEWIRRLLKLKATDVVWKAPWMQLGQMLYMCGDEPWVPLIGPWGIISYAPIMVRRQYGSEQFNPITHGLSQLEFSYGGFGTTSKAVQIVKMWGKTFRVKKGIYSDKATPRYMAWRAQRSNDIVIPSDDGLAPFMSPTPQGPPSDLERAQQNFEEKKAKWEMKKEKLQEELEKMKKKMEEQEWEIYSLSKEKEQDRLLKIDLDNTFQTLTAQNQKFQKDANWKKVIKIKKEKRYLKSELKKKMALQVDDAKKIAELEEQNQNLQQKVEQQNSSLKRVPELEKENEKLQLALQESKSQNNELDASIKDLSHELRLQVEANQIHRDDYEKLVKVVEKYKVECECFQDNYIFETLQNQKIALTRDVWRFEYLEERAQREYLEKQIRKAMVKAKEMAARTSALRDEVWPNESYGQRLVYFLEESLDLYRQTSSFFSMAVVKTKRFRMY